MSRISIDVTPEQHYAIKSLALINGCNVKDFVLKQIFTPENKKSLSTSALAGCVLCEAHGGRQKEFNARTQRAMDATKQGKNIKNFQSLDALFADLRK